MAKEDKEYFKLMDEIDEINPYATYLDKSTLSRVDRYIDTGSLALNAIISGSLYKGIPEGRVVQFAGPSGCGKTFFVQKIIANAQKMGKYVIVFDSENAIDPESAINFGIDPTKVKYVTALTLENTRNAIFKFLKSVSESNKIGEFLIIIDSLANMESELGEKRMDKESTSADMGTFAKSVKSLLKTCTNWSAITKTSIVFTNHVYDNPNQMYPSLEKDITGGKYALYMPSVTVQMAKKATKDDEGKTIDNTLSTGQKNYSGAILRCLTVKNRFIKPFLEVELYLSFATGLDKFYGLLELMRGLGVVILDGKTYKDWNGDSLGYYKNWRKDKDVWKKLLPELENRLQTEWAFSKEEAPYDEEDIVDVPDEEIQVEESPLDKLKNMKKKVSSKLDKLEGEISIEDES
jgi:RecA/RadA recombinase